MSHDMINMLIHRHFDRVFLSESAESDFCSDRQTVVFMKKRRLAAHWQGKLVDTMSIAWGYVLSTEHPWESVHEISKAADIRMYERKAYFYRESGVDRRKS